MRELIDRADTFAFVRLVFTENKVETRGGRMTPEEVETFQQRIEAAIKATPTAATTEGSFATCAHYPKSKHASGCAILTERVCATKGKCSFFSPRDPADELPPELAFAENLRRARIMAGLTPAQFSKAAGISRQTVSKWERGEAIPTPENMEKIAAALGIDVAVLK